MSSNRVWECQPFQDNRTGDPKLVGLRSVWRMAHWRLKKRDGVREMGAKPVKALRGFCAANQASLLRDKFRGSQGSRKTPEALRGQGPCSAAPFPFLEGGGQS